MIDSFVQSFRMAVKSIAGNKMRAFLTMLGIIIGVMALVILVSLVNGATSSVGCGDYVLQPGDRVEWVYTTQLGQDVP